MEGITTRAATADDVEFLRDMLFEALYVAPGGEPFPRSVIAQPELAHYVDGFGRPGDVGVIALEDDGPIGAAWARRLTGPDAGYGYVDDETPELSIAVASNQRGRGIGSWLLSDLLTAVAATATAVSLSVDSANPAARLYERFGFCTVGGSGTSITMLKHLPRFARAVSAHEIATRAPIQVAVGETVTVGERDADWPAFVFVTAAHGAGWVPSRYLSIDAGTALITTPYDTTELPTAPGDRLELVVRDDLSGWHWCRAETGREGWVPIRTLEELA